MPAEHPERLCLLCPYAVKHRRPLRPVEEMSSSQDSWDYRWSEAMEVPPSVSPLLMDRARCDTAPSADDFVVCLFLRWEALIREIVLFSF